MTTAMVYGLIAAGAGLRILTTVKAVKNIKKAIDDIKNLNESGQEMYFNPGDCDGDYVDTTCEEV